MVGSPLHVSSLRLDIQGLRALAVALVLVFHLSPTLLSGGYIGVDVFFVISGYLITNHLLREVERTGAVNLPQFWARRVRRLLPAALLVLMVSALLVLVMLPRTGVQQNLTDIALAGVYVLNWALALSSVDYLAADNAPSIAQHYWSLSIEEQFYLVWPVLIIIAVWVARKLKRVSRHQAVAGVLLVVFIASLLFSIYETSRSQPSAYFVTTTRAWEFAVGGLLAMVPVVAMQGRLSALVKVVGSWVAVAAILGSAAIFDAGTAFPGWIALVPVLSTGFLLWIGDDDSTWSPQFMARLGPVQFVGDASYSIYLWHWPLIVVFVAVEGRSPGWKWMLVLAVLTIALGALTKRFVEDPIRHSSGLLRRVMPTYGAMLVGIAAVAALTVVPIQIMKVEDAAYFAVIDAEIANPNGCFGAYSILNSCADPYAVTETVNPAATVNDSFANGIGASDACSVEPALGARQMSCELSPATTLNAAKIVLIGDSHAEAITPAFAALGSAMGWGVTSHTKSGCPTFFEIHEPVVQSDEVMSACAAWAGELYDELATASDVSLVVVAIRTTRHDRELNIYGAVERLQQLKDAGRAVAVFRTVPGSENWWITEREQPPRFAPDCVEQHMDQYDPCAWIPTQAEDWLVEAAEFVGIPIIDPAEVLCSDAGTCHVVIGGTIAYFDGNHMTATFAKTLAPWLAGHLERLGLG